MGISLSEMSTTRQYTQNTMTPLDSENFTITNTSDNTTTIQISEVDGVEFTPNTFTLAPNQSQDITITFDMSQINSLGIGQNNISCPINLVTQTIIAPPVITPPITLAIYNVTISANPNNAGIVSGGDGGGSGPINDSNNVITTTAYAGYSISAEISPDSGYQFLNWTLNGNVASTNLSDSFVITSDTSLIANFIAGQYIVTVTSNSTDGVGNGSASGGGTAAPDSLVTVQASPNSNSQFISWTDTNGNILSTDSQYTFTITQDTIVVANFSAIPVVVAPTSTYYLVSTTVGSIDNIGNGSVSYSQNVLSGTSVIVSATPDNNSSFVNWTSYGVVQSTDSTYIFVPMSNIQLVGNFISNNSSTDIPEPPADGSPKNVGSSIGDGGNTDIINTGPTSN